MGDRMDRMIAIMVLLALVAGCSRTPQTAVPPVLGLPLPGVRLIATPDRGPACGALNFHVHFDWVVAAPQIQNDFDLRVDSPIGKLLASGHRVGHADTGNWARAGQWFFLVAPDTRDVVAAVRIGPDDCIQ